MKNKVSATQMINQLCDGLEKTVASREMREFIPTGALEPAIIHIGRIAKAGQTIIINVQCANKLGKTAIAAVILRNIIWDCDKEYFDYPAYKDWPYYNTEYDAEGKLTRQGDQIKRFRIIGTATNTGDSGPIKEEINKWWPQGLYHTAKEGKTYTCKYEMKNGWWGDILTFEQQPKEFEGPLISVQWIDEPAKAELMTPITSRFSKGGILLITHTPEGAGPMLDILDDLKDKGAKVLKVHATLWENSVTSGTLNSKGTKRGLQTDEEIENYISTIALDQRPARVEGKNIGRSGKIYPDYEDNGVHVRNFELDADYTKLWNAYCVMDPHDKYYPFISWWAFGPLNSRGLTTHICYNEWPTFNTLKGYYDERRHTVQCNLTPKDISQIIKILDGTSYGINIMGRVIDPRFSKNSDNDFTKKTDGIRMEYQPYDIIWEHPKIERIKNQRDYIRELMKYDTNLPAELREPQFLIAPWCRNTRRSFARHHWVPDEKNKGLEVESEMYKDPCDNARMYFAYIKNRPWKKPTQSGEKKILFKPDNTAQSLSKGMKEISLR